MIYTYTTQYNAMILQSAIKSQTYGSLYSSLCGLGNQLELHFTQALSETDKQHLDNLIAQHGGTFQSSFDYMFQASINSQEQNINFGRTLLHDWMRRNTLEGMNISQSLHVFSRFEDFYVNFGNGPKKVDLFKMFYSGAIPTIYFSLLQVAPDSMVESYHWLTQERLDWVKNQVANYLGANMVAYIHSIQPS
jgi:hypothetical protein